LASLGICSPFDHIEDEVLQFLRRLIGSFVVRTEAHADDVSECHVRMDIDSRRKERVTRLNNSLHQNFHPVSFINRVQTFLQRNY
jgi:hypothetical protein